MVYVHVSLEIHFTIVKINSLAKLVAIETIPLIILDFDAFIRLRLQYSTSR